MREESLVPKSRPWTLDILQNAVAVGIPPHQVNWAMGFQRK